MSFQVETTKPPGGASPLRGRRLLAWLLAGAAAAVAVLVVAAVVALRSVDLSRFTGTIAAAVKSQTGRELTVGRGPHLRISLLPSIVLEDVALSNAPWGSRKEMVRVKRVELRVKLLALLHGEILVDRLVLAGPDVLLETDEKGEGNWVLGQPGQAASSETPGTEGSLLSRVGIREVRVTDALLAYRDGCAGWRVGVHVPHLALAASRRSKGNLDVEGALSLDRAVVSVSGVIGGVDSMLGSRPFPLALSLSMKGAVAKLEGAIERVRDLAGVDLKITLEVTDPKAVAASLGTAPPGLAPFQVECRVRDSGKGWALDPLRFTAGRSSISGSVGYVMGCPRSKISAELRAALLDLGELTGAGKDGRTTSNAPATKGGKLFSAEPLPLDVLRAFDVTAAVQVETLVLPGGAEARSVAARAVLTNGRLVVDPLSLTLGGGRISGSLRLDAGRRPGFTANLTGSDVELRALLALLGARADVSGGPTDLTIALAGSGGSLHEWVASLGGKVRIVVGPGRIEGAALMLGGDVLTGALDAVNPFRKSDTSTELRCAVINVPVERGVVRLDRRVAVETSKINIVLAGMADLGTEMLDVGFRSKATQGLGMGLANFAGAVRVQGPFTSPALGVDAEGTAMAASTLQSAVKSRGRSLFQGRIQEMFVAESPCKDALGEAPPSRPWPLSLFRKR
ncbi:MAG: AsmA family protein [Thermoanaerobaculaceae bacterium]|nr:AsmA family protein [Thermoanaerobaculaceae bacterium]